MGILAVAFVIMPWLTKEKCKLSSVTGSGALRADAAESALCVYLSLIAFVGVGMNAVSHIRWADPVAALLITLMIIWEGRNAVRGKSCDCPWSIFLPEATEPAKCQSPYLPLC